MKNKIAPLILFYCCFFYSCVTLNPEAPELSSEELQTIVPNSTLNLPLELNLGSFEGLLNENIPKSLFQQSGINAGHGIKLKLEVERAGEIMLTTSNGNINTSVPIYIKGRADWSTDVWVTKIKHHENFDARVTVNTSTDLGIDEHWNIIAKTESSFKMSKSPSIEILGIKISFGSIASSNIEKQLPKINQIIEQEVRKSFDLKSEVEKYWNELDHPFLITKNPEKVWGAFEPTYFSFSPPITIDYKTIQLNLALATKIKVHIGETPPDHEIGELVPVKNDVLDDNSFNINFPIGIEIPALEKLAKKELIGKTYPIPKTKREVLINDVNIYGDADYLVFKMNIESQKTNGDIFLISKLVYDPLTHIISLKNLEFDANTNKILVDKAAWLMNTFFLSAIEKELTYDATNDFNRAQLEIEKAINSVKIDKSVILKAEVNGISVNALKTNTNMVHVNSTINGTLNVNIDY